ncbi:unnamed protein product [Arabidopsis thaliana]|uniref:Uncharacterized protein n=3 Tax=Arabidopsis TaxID=3701 RepID=A0A178W6F9_ARATH|nr:hypothetical protein ISN45_At01g051350 [Arabidopsis thaliana x Arabidopsis arenosa]KAG7658028.1 hypothetical protein ISN44_As01g050360 [Arabidopsis suecica]OAP14079.1 hypothetical protein AXX17_AT1G54190 [Arabidopsis thaliana]CAA0306325.1 unnamed protein product [Arabidopsis thaliana]VYS49611.1 unnamed protein product [Arabidopsis thaliana]
MRPETREIIEKMLLPAMKLVKERLDREVEKQSMDEFMFCFENCYTEKETEMHVTRKFPSLKQSDVGIGFQTFIGLIDKESSREAYLKDAEDCANVRRIEARHGEASTSHKCEPNCNKHYD